MTQLWPMFYRYIAFDGLVFVVSTVGSNFEFARKWIRRLLNEDDLRRTQIVVILNTFDQPKDSIENQTRAVTKQLGLSEMKALVDYPDRYSWCTVNCKDGDSDPEFAKIMEQFLHLMALKQHGTA